MKKLKSHPHVVNLLACCTSKGIAKHVMLLICIKCSLGSVTADNSVYLKRPTFKKIVDKFF